MKYILIAIVMVAQAAHAQQRMPSIALVDSLTFDRFKNAQFCEPQSVKAIKNSSLLTVQAANAAWTIRLNRTRFEAMSAATDADRVNGLFLASAADIIVVAKPRPRAYVRWLPNEEEKYKTYDVQLAKVTTACTFDGDFISELSEVLGYNAIVTKQDGNKISVTRLFPSAVGAKAPQALLFKGSHLLPAIERNFPVAAIAEVSETNGFSSTLTLLLRDASMSQEFKPGTKAFIDERE